MIILNVSGYKSGGTWLQNIINVGTTNFKLIRKSNDLHKIDTELKYIDVPEKFGNSDNQKKMNHIIGLSKIDRDDNVLDKVHFYSSDSEIARVLCDTDIKFFVMERDFKDIIVSRYYHEISSSRFSGDFNLFFKTVARNFLTEAYNYNSFWAQVQSLGATMLRIKYAELKNNYDVETGKIKEFLGEEIFNQEKVKHLNSINVNREFHTESWMVSFKEKGGDFYRKGIVGDFKTHFTDEHLSIFEQWIEQLRSSN